MYSKWRVSVLSFATWLIYAITAESFGVPLPLCGIDPRDVFKRKSAKMKRSTRKEFWERLDIREKTLTFSIGISPQRGFN
ncbi:MAG: hypothetical protein ACK4SY_04960 [Pyrobaculum sp.]